MGKTVKILIQGYEDGDTTFSARDDINAALAAAPRDGETILKVKPDSLENLRDTLNDIVSTNGHEGVNYELIVSAHGLSVKDYDNMVANGTLPEGAPETLRTDGMGIQHTPHSFEEVFSAIPKEMAGSMYLDACFSGNALAHVDSLPTGFALYPSGLSDITFNADDKVMYASDLIGLIEQGRTSPEDFYIEAKEQVVTVGPQIFSGDAAIGYGVSGAGSFKVLSFDSQPFSYQVAQTAESYISGDKSDMLARDGQILGYDGTENQFEIGLYHRQIPIADVAANPINRSHIPNEHSSMLEDSLFLERGATTSVLSFIQQRDEQPFTSSILTSPAAIKQIYDGGYLSAYPETQRESLQQILQEYTDAPFIVDAWQPSTARAYVEALKAHDLPIETSPNQLIYAHQQQQVLQAAQEVGGALKEIGGSILAEAQAIGDALKEMGGSILSEAETTNAPAVANAAEKATLQER